MIKKLVIIVLIIITLIAMLSDISIYIRTLSQLIPALLGGVVVDVEISPREIIFRSAQPETVVASEYDSSEFSFEKISEIGMAFAQEHPTSMELPPEYRRWFVNPDGSCVQCSIGMVGMHINRPEWTFVLWDTEYGPAQRGGSWPGRVERYARERGMRIFNVTGSSYEDTRKWMEWAAKTNRFAAIGAGTAHFQTLYGYDPLSDKPWKVCNNNSTYKIDEYTEEEFKRLHLRSGPWVVVPNEPSVPKVPEVVEWWK